MHLVFTEGNNETKVALIVKIPSIKPDQEAYKIISTGYAVFAPDNFMQILYNFMVCLIEKPGK